MRMIMEFLKELSQVIFMLWIFTVISKLFFRRTLLGKTIAVIFKGIFKSIKLVYGISKGTGVGIYKNAERFYKFIDKKYKAYDKKKQDRQLQEKVANGEFDNVVDLKKFIAEKQQNKSR